MNNNLNPDNIVCFQHLLIITTSNAIGGEAATIPTIGITFAHAASLISAIQPCLLISKPNIMAGYIDY